MAAIRIFISSVQKEFSEERKALVKYIREDALLRRFFEPFIFEELPAINLSAPEAYLAEAAQSEIYLGIFGKEYGYEDADGVSPTEREFDKATEQGNHRIVFVKRCSDSCRGMPYPSSGGRGPMRMAPKVAPNPPVLRSP